MGGFFCAWSAMLSLALLTVLLVIMIVATLLGMGFFDWAVTGRWGAQPQAWLGAKRKKNSKAYPDTARPLTKAP